MNYSVLDDEVLVKLIRISDGKALEEIYRRHWKSVFNAAYFRLRSQDIAKEMVQNLFVRLWEKRETLTIEDVGAYLHTAMKNSVINYVESKVVEKKYFGFARQQPEPEAQKSDSTLLVSELNKAIERAIQQLPEKTQHIFRLSRFENLTAREIAQNVGLTEKAVEYHLTKSLKVLRLHLKEFIFLFLVASFLVPPDNSAPEELPAINRVKERMVFIS